MDTFGVLTWVCITSWGIYSPAPIGYKLLSSVPFSEDVPLAEWEPLWPGRQLAAPHNAFL